MEDDNFPNLLLDIALLRSLSIPAELEFMRAASYGSGTSSSGKLRLAHMVEGPLVGRHVLLVEDIVDSGRTVNAIAKRIRRLGPASLRLAALLDRPARREEEVQIDFTGFVIPDKFVIGYGLDYAGLYRELPGIYSLTLCARPPRRLSRVNRGLICRIRCGWWRPTIATPRPSTSLTSMTRSPFCRPRQPWNAPHLSWASTRPRSTSITSRCAGRRACTCAEV